MQRNDNQKIYLHYGRTGCHLLCLIRMAENITGKTIDIIESYKELKRRGLIREDCYINSAGEVLSFLTGRNFETKLLQGDFPLTGKEYAIARWVWKDGNETRTHFTIPLPNGKTFFEPWEDNRVEKHGKIDCYRIYYEVKPKRK